MSNPRKTLLAAGARPNIMKLAGLHHRLGTDSRFDLAIRHTDQCLQKDISEVFLRTLNFPEPHFFLNVRASTVTATTGLAYWDAQTSTRIAGAIAR